jgi:hypothetical protein
MVRVGREPDPGGTLQNRSLALAHVTRTGKVQNGLQQYSRPKLTFLHDLPASLDVTRDQLHLPITEIWQQRILDLGPILVDETYITQIQLAGRDAIFCLQLSELLKSKIGLSIKMIGDLDQSALAL